MMLSEKIHNCRKKKGLSQDALAEKMGVSRQAVSKWETGESSPELGKMKALADVLGVTVDWLLSDEEAEPEVRKPSDSASDRLPVFLRHLVQKYGWVAGLILALWGLLPIAMGILMRVQVRRLILGNLSVWGSEATQTATQMLRHNPVYMISGVALTIGALAVLGGLLLAVWLWKKRK